MKRAIRKSPSFWALSASITLHIILLAVFAAVEFTSSVTAQTKNKQNTPSTASLIKKVSSPLTLPKPKVTTFRHQTAHRLFELDELMPAKKTDLTSQDPEDNSKRKNYSFQISDEYFPAETSQGFFSDSDRNKNLCYVVDCSGSMQGLFAQVRKQLIESINSLRPDQYFSIVFFRGEEILQVTPGAMIRASASNKTKALKLINSIEPKGTTDPLNAIRIALSARDNAQRPPQKIFFLTDGLDLQPQNSSDFAKKVKDFRQNLLENITINTIAFWAQPQDALILEKIAKENGGKFIKIGK